MSQRFWFASSAWYNSGLPVETAGIATDALAARYGQAVLDRVNISRGRVQPSAAVDVSAGATVVKQDRRSVVFPGDLRNITNRLNVVNLAGLFSGKSDLAGPSA